MLRILLTGFEPFGGESINPTQKLVEFPGAAVPGVMLSTTILPVDRERAAGVLFQAIDEHRPDAVIMLGEAGGRARITPERVAINVDSYRIPDNAGNQPHDEPVVAGGPAAYFSTLPLARMLDRLEAAAIPAAMSNSAGTYLCNHVFYALMHRIETQGLPMRAGFVHVPYAYEQVIGKADGVPSLSIDTMSTAVQLLVEAVRDSATA